MWQRSDSGAVLCDLRRATVLFAVALVAGAGLLIGVLSSSSNAIVLASCEDAIDENLQKCYDAGSGMLATMSELLVDGAVGDVESRMRSFLEMPVTDTQTLVKFMTLFHPNVSDNYAFADSAARPLMAAAMEVKSAKGLVRLELFGGGGMQKGLPLGDTAFMLALSSPQALVGHTDGGDWADYYKKHYHFVVLQYEGLEAEASTECPSRPETFLAAVGPTDERGRLLPNECVGQNLDNTGCQDRIRQSSFCHKTGWCNCPSAVRQYRCDGGGTVEVNGTIEHWRMKDLCLRTCKLCHDVDNACFQTAEGKLSARWESAGKKKIKFTVVAEVNDAENRWVGIGFSCSGHMPGSSMVIATRLGVTDRYARKYAEPVVDFHQDISDASVEVRDGSFTFTFTRPLKSTDVKDNSLLRPIHVLLATGEVNFMTGDLLHHSSRTFSLDKIDLTKPCGNSVHGSHSTDSRPPPHPGDRYAKCRHNAGERILHKGEILFRKTYQYPAETVRWAPVEHQGPFLVLAAYAAVGDPDDPRRRVGLVKAGVDIRGMSLLMRDIADKLLGEGGRIYAVQVDNSSGQVLALAGASHGSVMSGSTQTKVNVGESDTDGDQQAVMPWNLKEGVDKIVANHALGVSAGGYVYWFRTSEGQRRMQQWKYDDEDYFVKFSPLDSVTKGDERRVADSGLGLVVVVLMRRKTSVGDLDTAMARARARIDKEEEADQSHRSRSVSTTSILLGLVVVLLAVAVALFVWRLSPSGVAIEAGGGQGISMQLQDSPPLCFETEADELEEVGRLRERESSWAESVAPPPPRHADERSIATSRLPSR